MRHLKGNAMKTELAKSLLEQFDIIALREIANGMSHCAEVMTKYAKEAHQNKSGLMPDYLSDATDYEQIANLLKSIIRKKTIYK
jgi:hypothetical protein